MQQGRAAAVGGRNEQWQRQWRRDSSWGCCGAGSPTRPKALGITTPQKLQRAQSNTVEEAAGMLGCTPTPGAAIHLGQIPGWSQQSSRVS